MAQGRCASDIPSSFLPLVWCRSAGTIKKWLKFDRDWWHKNRKEIKRQPIGANVDTQKHKTKGKSVSQYTIISIEQQHHLLRSKIHKCLPFRFSCFRKEQFILLLCSACFHFGLLALGFVVFPPSTSSIAFFRLCPWGTELFAAPPILDDNFSPLCSSLRASDQSTALNEWTYSRQEHKTLCKWMCQCDKHHGNYFGRL